MHQLDADIGISWPADLEIILSAKDQAAPSLPQLRDAGVLPSYAQCSSLTAQLRAAAANPASRKVGADPGAES